MDDERVWWGSKISVCGLRSQASNFAAVPFFRDPRPPKALFKGRRADIAKHSVIEGEDFELSMSVNMDPYQRTVTDMLKKLVHSPDWKPRGNNMSRCLILCDRIVRNT